MVNKTSPHRAGLVALISTVILLTQLACAGPVVIAPEITSVAITSKAAVVPLPTSEPVEAVPSPSPIAPPTHPLRAWSVAANGALFVLDAAYRLYHLAPIDLSPLAQSPPLFAAAADAPAFLLADESRLIVGSRAVTQTLLLRRDDFSLLHTLEQAGPLALDPVSQRLFLVPEPVFEESLTFTGRFLSYDLANLNQPPREIELSCLRPLDLLANPPARRLYVRTGGICSSPPHRREAYTIYDLDTLAGLGQSPPELGVLTRPALGGQAGFMVATLKAKSGFFFDDRLLILDRAGQTLHAYKALDGWPVISPAGDWLYLSRERALWVLAGPDFLLRSILFFDRPPPAEVVLSPTGDRLYLFGNGWLNVQSVAELQTLGIPLLSPFPAAWPWPDPTTPSILAVGLYRSPQLEQDGVAFIQYGQESYRTTDGGQSWQLLPALLDPDLTYIQSLSLSPDLAADRTVVIQAGSALHRSTDNGDTWQKWAPPIAFVSERDGNRELYLMDQAGQNPLRLTDTPAAEENPAWSPAWTRLAFQSDRNSNWDIFSQRLDCGEDKCEAQQLTDSPADDLLPAWSPDGRAIAFVSTRDGNPEIYVMDRDGHNQRRLTFNPGGDWRPAWLPDSRQLLFTSDRGGNNDLYQLTLPADAAPLTAEPELLALTTDPADDRDPAVSGQTLYFLSNRDGLMRAYQLDLSSQFVQPYPVTAAARPEGHPSPVAGSPYTLLITADDSADVSTIYRVSRAEYTPLTSGSTFDGQPAWGPVLWKSGETLSAGGLVK